MIRFNLLFTDLRKCEVIMQTHNAPAPTFTALILAYSPDKWLFKLFSPLAVAEAGPLRCDVAEVEAHLGRDRFLAEVKLRGYKAHEKAGQFTLTSSRPLLRVMV